MAASIETIREKMDVQPTKEDKGPVCTIRVTAYDNGMIMVDGRPIHDKENPEYNWVWTSEVIGCVIGEFCRQVLARRKSRH